MTRFARLFLALALAIAGGTATVAAAEIVVLVNGIPITNYDIAQRVAMQRISGQSPSNASAREELINEAVQMSEARRFGITVSDANVEQAFGNIAQQVKMGARQFAQALSQSGVNPDTLRNRLRVQIAWQTLMQRRMSRAVVRQDEITQQLQQRGDEAATMNEYRLQAIIFVVPANSSANLYAQRRREAESFRQRFRGCDGAIAQAQALRGVVVRDLGRRDSTQLVGPQGEEIQKTRVGRTTAPDQTDAGIELIAVCDITQIRSSAAARQQIENQLLMSQGEELGKEYLAELREKAIIQQR